MYFPDLKIVGKVTNEDPRLEKKELLVVELDWTDIDNKKIESRKSWYIKYGIENPTSEQKMALSQMLEELDWSEYLYPNKYKFIFDKYFRFKITNSYYEECIHLRKMAIEEWNRQRPFDTNVRESLLYPAISFIESFFYLINDAIYIFNPELKSDNSDNDYFEHSVLLRSLMLFRFWRFQTGGGLLVDRSTEFVKRYNDSIRDKFDTEVKPDLIDSVRLEPFGLSQYYPDREERLLILVNQRVRDNRLENVLNK